MKVFYLGLFLFFFNSIMGFSQSKPTTPESKIYGFTPALIRGPYLQVATDNSIIVRWRTDENDVSFVRYGTDLQNLNLLGGNSHRTREHLVTLNNLKPATKYYYLIEGVRDTLQWEENNYFVTLPVVGEQEKYRIGIFGDCGNNSINQRNTRDQFEKYLGDNILNAWILLGDNAYSFGKDEEYQANFFNIYKDGLLRKSPLFPAPGNHDYHDERFAADHAQQSKEVAYYNNFSMPTKGESGGVPSHTQAFYSFDLGNIHFISLDSHGEEDRSASRLFDTLGRQVKWVKQDLEANKNKDWIVVYWHHPPYSMGSHNSDTETQMRKIRENFIGILERYGVDLILCGHSHSYERSKLMKGHFGLQNTFDPEKHLLSSSSGKFDGSENSHPYIKDETNQGTVYVVSGSAGALDHKQGTFPHKAMPYSDISVGGAPILEVEGNRLDFRWITANGEIGDQFTILKKVNKKTIIDVKEGKSVTLTASYKGEYNWNGSDQKTKSIQVKPTSSISTYVVNDPKSYIQDVFEVRISK